MRCLATNVLMFLFGTGIVLLFMNPVWQGFIAMRDWLWQGGMLFQVASPWLSAFLSGVAGFLLFDFSNYLRHRFMHSKFFLMRVHGIHHLANELNASVDLKFQPLEVISIQLLLFAVWGIFNVPYYALLVYIMITTAIGLWSHTGSRRFHLPKRWRFIHRIVMTPRAHHIHHLCEAKFFNKNFGVVLSIWDVMFGTYVSPETVDLTKHQYGLPHCREADCPGFWRQLILPFKRSGYIGQKREKVQSAHFANQRQDV